MLSRDEVDQVLRYWLAALRFEEALAARPRAQRPGGPPPPLDVSDPPAGQPYFKVAADEDGLGFLLRGESRLVLPLSPDRAAFCARWLRKIYRRRVVEWREREGESMSVVAGWPTVYFPRSDELAPLLRFRARVAWMRADGAPFEPPSRRKLARGKVPAPPAALVLHTSDEEDADLLPFSFDAQLLVRHLGVTEEEVADLNLTLRGAETVSATAMAATLTGLLSTDGGWTPALAEVDDEVPTEQVFAQLVDAMGHRLVQGRRSPKVYPVGLVHDGEQILATRHLQRDLSVLLGQRLGPDLLHEGGPLWGYLSGRAPPPGWAALAGAYTPYGLTPDQREVAEQFLGSVLTAAQGPPGTGKTELILNLAAATLVERVRAMEGGRPMGASLLVVASTNNRAVDNVTEPLSRGDGLPLALRAGSQAVTSTVTVETLQRVQAWLEAQPVCDVEVHEAHLQTTLARFDALSERVEAQDGARAQALQRVARYRTVAARIEVHEAALAAAAAAGRVAPPSWRPYEAVLDAIKAVARRLGGLTRGLVGRDAETLVETLARWKRVAQRPLAELHAALAAVGAESIGLPLPPEVSEGAEVEAHLDAWEDALEDALEVLETRRLGLVETVALARRAETLAALGEELADLPPPGSVAIPAGAPALHHHQLFLAAKTVREAWTLAQRGTVGRALERAIDGALQTRSLRRVFDEDVALRRVLVQLFPVLGTTLLSMGNVVAAGRGGFERLVIDEGGQCHPAYVVSGLLRADAALIIGDVHQLEPVIRLTEDDEARVQRMAAVTMAPQRMAPYRVHTAGTASAQRLADEAVTQRLALPDHFRCQPEIISICDALCGYGLRVHTPPGAVTSMVPALSHAVMLSPVTGTQVRLRGSWHNPPERARVMALLRGLLEGGVPAADIAVITPYVGQLDMLREAMNRVGLPIEGLTTPHPGAGRGALGGVATGTVHRFQGGERRVVLFSTVVTEERSLRFLNGRVNLVNVAVSRAREHLVVVGSPEILRRGPYSRLLVEHATVLEGG